MEMLLDSYPLLKQSVLIDQLLFQFMPLFPLCAGLALSSSLLAAGSFLLDSALGVSESPPFLNMRSRIF